MALYHEISRLAHIQHTHTHDNYNKISYYSKRIEKNVIISPPHVHITLCISIDLIINK